MANVRELDVKSLPDLREMLYTVAGVCNTCVAFHEKKEGFYQHISYGRFLEELEALGTALGGVLPDGARVLIVGKNSYAWALAFLCVSCGGRVPLPADAPTGGCRTFGERTAGASYQCKDRRGALRRDLRGATFRRYRSSPYLL